MSHKTLVVGTGVTGQSVMRYLQRMKIDFDVFDTRFEISELDDLKNKYPKSKFYLGDELKLDWQIIEQVIVSPGLEPSTAVIVKAQTLDKSVVGDLELFAKHQQNKPLITMIQILLELAVFMTRFILIYF